MNSTSPDKNNTNYDAHNEDDYLDEKHIEQDNIFSLARKDFSLTRKKIYFNNGSIGPLPISSIKAITDFNFRYSDEGPDSPVFNQYLDSLKLETRKRIADLIKCDQDEIVFTQSTTEGINFIVNGLTLKKKDTLLVRDSENEHFSNYLPWIKASLDRSVSLEKYPRINKGASGSTLLEEFNEIYQKGRYKIVSTSHIMYNNGSITPVEEFGKIIDENKKNYNTLFSIDGAQSVGLLDINVKNIKCDFMTFPGFKWICGPLGVGILYINKKAMEEVKPIFLGSGSAHIKLDKPTQKKGKERNNKENNKEEFLEYNEYPDKFHSTFRNFPGLAGLESSLRYILRIGLTNIYNRNKILSNILRQELLRIKGIVLHEAEEEKYRSPLVSFSFDRNNNENVESLYKKLYDKGIVLAVREIGERKILRASPHFYNTEDEILRVSEEIRKMVKQII